LDVTEEIHDQPPDFLEMLADARKAVLEVNWSAWKIPAGDVPLTSRWFADQPPLTSRFFAQYLEFCGWIWQRPISPVEQQRAREMLIQHWAVVGSDTSQQQAVLSLVWLFSALQNISPSRQESIRQQCVAHIPDGAFPGMDVPLPPP